MATNSSVDIIHTATTGYGFGNSSTEVKRYQTFIAPDHCTGTVHARVKIRRVSGPTTGRPLIELYATQQHKPSGAPIAQGYCSSLAITSSFGIVAAQLYSSSIIPGAEYAIVLSTTDTPDRFEWAVTPVSDRVGFGKWDGRQWVDESQLGDAWLQVATIGADNAIDLTHQGTTGFTFGQAYDQIARFQTFLARELQPITGIDLKLRKLPGTTHSDVVVELYATSNHRPAGNALASAAIAAASIGSAWTVVNAPLYFAEVSLENEYAVVLRQRTPGTATYEWAVAQTNRVTSFGKWNGSAWIDESSLGDGWLKVWVMPPYRCTTVDIMHNRTLGNGFGNVTDELSRFQTFTLTRERTVIGVDLKLRRFQGTAQSEVTCELRATANGVPTGTVLAFGELSPFALSGDWSIVHLPLKSHALAAGTYAIVLSQRVLAQSRYEWAVGTGPGRFGKWTGRTWVDETGLGNGWTRVWTSDPDFDLDFSHMSTMGFGFGNTTDELKRYQTFTVPAGWDCYDLNGVQLRMRKYAGTSQSDLVVELYDTLSPAALPKATAVLPSTFIRPEWTTVFVPLYFAFDAMGQGIVPGRQYAIVLSQRVAASARYEWAAAGESFGKWNGTAWIGESGLGYGWLKVSLIGRMGPQ